LADDFGKGENGWWTRILAISLFVVDYLSPKISPPTGALTVSKSVLPATALRQFGSHGAFGNLCSMPLIGGILSCILCTKSFIIFIISLKKTRELLVADWVFRSGCSNELFYWCVP
jgi:hypothetical protein